MNRPHRVVGHRPAHAVLEIEHRRTVGHRHQVARHEVAVHQHLGLAQGVVHEAPLHQLEVLRAIAIQGDAEVATEEPLLEQPGIALQQRARRTRPCRAAARSVAAAATGRSPHRTRCRRCPGRALARGSGRRGLRAAGSLPPHRRRVPAARARHRWRAARASPTTGAGRPARAANPSGWRWAVAPTRCANSCACRHRPRRGSGGRRDRRSAPGSIASVARRAGRRRDLQASAAQHGNGQGKRTGVDAAAQRRPLNKRSKARMATAPSSAPRKPTGSPARYQPMCWPNQPANTAPPMPRRIVSRCSRAGAARA